jgi:hypothetical protein
VNAEQWLQLLAVMPDHRFYSRVYGLNRFALSSGDLGEYLDTLPDRIVAAEGNDRIYLGALQQELQREQAWLQTVGL